MVRSVFGPKRPRGRAPAPERIAVQQFPCPRCGAPVTVPCTPPQHGRLGHAPRLRIWEADEQARARG